MNLTDRLRNLVAPKLRGKGRLPIAEDKPQILGGLGIGQPIEVGGGITSPLSEQPNTRTYYDEQFIRSSDGLFVIVFENIETAQFTDGDGNPLTISYVNENSGPTES